MSEDPKPGRKSKRLAFCFDGTWNRIDGKHPTNVARIAQTISAFDKSGTPQLIYYDEGVGTTRTERWSGGIFGHGLNTKMLRAYHNLVLNYEPGDSIYVFGFSRGAFTARSFVGLLRNAGIMSRRSLHHISEAVQLYVNRDENSSPSSERARRFRLKHCPHLCLPGDLKWRREHEPGLAVEGATPLDVAYLGVWDTVGALGIPQHLKWLAWLNGTHKFHDTNLSNFVQRARHAVSADERRRSFEPGLWTNLGDLNTEAGEPRYEQLIFPGVHSAIGGGGPVRGLSDAALEWVLRGARKAGLAFDTDEDSPVFQLRPDHRAELFNTTGKRTWTVKDRAMGVGLKWRDFSQLDALSLHETLVRRYAEPADRLPEKALYRPQSIGAFEEALKAMAEERRQTIGAAAETVADAGDERALQAPVRVRQYIIQRGDTQPSIAETEMGTRDDADILSLHNRNVGLLFEDAELYAGSCLEIPEYAPRAVSPSAPIDAKPTDGAETAGSTTGGGGTAASPGAAPTAAPAADPPGAAGTPAAGTPTATAPATGTPPASDTPDAAAPPAKPDPTSTNP